MVPVSYTCATPLHLSLLPTSLFKLSPGPAPPKMGERWSPAAMPQLPRPCLPTAGLCLTPAALDRPDPGSCRLTSRCGHGPAPAHRPAGRPGLPAGPGALPRAQLGSGTGLLAGSGPGASPSRPAGRQGRCTGASSSRRPGAAAPGCAGALPGDRHSPAAESRPAAATRPRSAPRAARTLRPGPLLPLGLAGPAERGGGGAGRGGRTAPLPASPQEAPPAAASRHCSAGGGGAIFVLCPRLGGRAGTGVPGGRDTQRGLPCPRSGPRSPPLSSRGPTARGQPGRRATPAQHCPSAPLSRRGSFPRRSSPAHTGETVAASADLPQRVLGPAPASSPLGAQGRLEPRGDRQPEPGRGSVRAASQ